MSGDRNNFVTADQLERYFDQSDAKMRSLHEQIITLSQQVRTTFLLKIIRLFKKVGNHDVPRNYVVQNLLEVGQGC